MSLPVRCASHEQDVLGGSDAIDQHDAVHVREQRQADEMIAALAEAGWVELMPGIWTFEADPR